MYLLKMVESFVFDNTIACWVGNLPTANQAEVLSFICKTSTIGSWNEGGFLYASGKNQQSMQIQE